MDLETTIQWLRNEIDKLVKEKADANQIRSFSKIYCWLDELERYRLCRSEFTREIELSGKKVITKEWLLKFIEDEVKDWKLDDIVE